MPANKKTTTNKNTKKAPQKRTASVEGKREPAKKNGSGKNPRGENAEQMNFMTQLAPYIIAVIAILFGVCMYAGDKAGIIGGAMNKLFIGLSGKLYLYEEQRRRNGGQKALHSRRSLRLRFNGVPRIRRRC